MTRYLFSLLVLLGTWAETVRAADPVALPAKEKFHLYLLIGQSNMAGRGEMAKDQLPPVRVVKFNKEQQWVPATDPLHFDKPPVAGVGPGSSFGPAMAAAAAADVTIGLIPSAVGGTPLQRWQKGGDLYKGAVERAQAAAKNGTLKGVIWHQGEADAGNAKTADDYGERLAKMIVDLRAELNSPNLPFVVGKLGEFLSESKSTHKATVNKALAEIPSKVAFTACVESTGLKAKSDQVHFDAAAAREFGQRYAQAMQQIQSQQKP